MRKIALTLALAACLPFLWQPLRGQSPSVREKSGSDKKQDAALSQPQAQPGRRGTKDAPFVVDTEGHVESPEEAAKHKADDDHKAFIDAWTVGSAIAVAAFTGVLMIIGYFGVRAAVRTLRAIEKQAALMETQIEDARKSSESSAKDVQASIAEAVRSAKLWRGSPNRWPLMLNR